MKDNKLVEKYDDNPGAYFGMLVEDWEDKEESLKEDYVTDLVGEILSKKVGQPKRGFKWLSNNGTSGEVEYRGQKFAFRKLPNGEYKVMRSSDAGWNWSETLFKDESLKEDKLNEARKVDYLEADLAEKSGDKDIYDAYDENELTIVKDIDIWYFERCPKGLDKKVKTLMKKYYPELNYLYDESLKEDKFVPRDKMSKKDKKELDSQKRNTWGNTNPVTRVQPNKKAYDRKRDKKVVDESLTEDSEIFKDMSNALDDIEYLCNDTYNWDAEQWNDKENVRRTAERIIESAQILLDSIERY